MIGYRRPGPERRLKGPALAMPAGNGVGVRVGVAVGNGIGVGVMDRTSASPCSAADGSLTGTAFAWR